MIIQPFPILTTLSAEELPSYECSDRIIIPKTFYDSKGYAPNDLLYLSNKHNQSITGTLFGTQESATETIYAPSWMLSRMDLLDNIIVAHAPKYRCKAMQLKPHSQVFAKRPDFLLQLNKAIINYRSLTKKTRIPLLVNGTLEFLTIESFSPSQHETFFVYGCGAVDIQIMESVECEKRKVSYLYLPNEPETHHIAFVGRGFTVGGVQPSISPQEAAAAAARKRLTAVKR